MTDQQRHYLSMMVKSRWNDLVTQVEMGERTEVETQDEFSMMGSFFGWDALGEDISLGADTILDGNAVFQQHIRDDA